MNPTRRAAWGALLSLPLVCSLALGSTPALAWTTGSGQVVSENRQVPAFEAITSQSSVNLQVRQGDVASLKISGDDNLLPLLETTVDKGRHGDTLTIRWKRGESVYTRSKIQVDVVVPKLSAISVAGSGNVRLSPFSTPSLQLSVAGSGDMKFEQLKAEQLSIAISGSGDIGGSGTVQRVKASVAGSGDVRLADLKADEVEVRIAGSGDAQVQAMKTLDVTIAGSGDVTYTGDAQVKSKVSGSGSVKKR